MLSSVEKQGGVRHQKMSRTSSTAAMVTSLEASIEGSFTQRFFQLLTGMIGSLRMWLTRYRPVRATGARDLF